MHPFKVISIIPGLVLCLVAFSPELAGQERSSPDYQTAYALASYAFATHAFAPHARSNLTEVSRLSFHALPPLFDQRSDWPDSIQAIWVRFTVPGFPAAPGKDPDGYKQPTGYKQPAGYKDSDLVLHLDKMIPIAYLYRLEQDSLVEIGRTGYELPYSRQTLRGDAKNMPLLFPADLRPAASDSHTAPGQSIPSFTTFYLCFRRYHDELAVVTPRIEAKDRALFEFQTGENRQLTGKIIQLFLAGFFLAIFVYSLLKFFSQVKDKAYLYYALVNFFCCIGAAIYYDIPNLESSLFPWCKNNKELCAIFSDAIIIFNMLFLRTIMELKTRVPRLFLFTQGYIVFHIVATIIVPVLASDPAYRLMGRISDLLYPVCEILCLAIYIVFVGHLWRRRTGFYRYLFYGCCVMTLGMFLFTLSSVFQTHEAFISKDGSIGEYIIMSFFIISQVCFFITALAQREKSTEQANAKYQAALIAQLTAGNLLQENFTRNLERQVAERSQQIVQQQQLLEQEHRDKVLALLNRRISETELKALRSQMNPHFIFNSLNSIENFMMKNDKRMASDYFGKFATLIRMILESSRNEWVPFGKDIEALQLYVELEQLRFDNRFFYSTSFDPALLTGDYNVPPLLIQPYVENAIIHGLAQSDKEALQLTVGAAVEEGYLVYTIQDNGIGRQKAEAYKRHKLPHKSMGMQITQERISILNQQQQAKGEVEIEDLFEEDGQPCGTRVLVKLKAL